MSAVDPVTALLQRLDLPVTPRPEFAQALFSRLLEELGGAPRPLGKRRSPRFHLSWILPGIPRGLRLAVIVLALLLLLAGIALATYFGVRTWVSAGPRGVQHASNYRLTLVFRDPPGRSGFWSSLQLAPDDRSVYGVRYLPPWPRRHAELERISGVQGQRARAQRVLDYQALARQPRLWDPGVDLSHAVVSEYHGLTEDPSQTIAVAANGDVFLLVGAWRSRKIDDSQPLDITVIVRHPDGSLQRILGLRELSRLLHAGPERVALTITASVPGELWIKAHVRVPPLGTGFGVYSLYDVVDPNRDGEWNDRIVRRLILPRSLPLADRARQGYQRTFLPQLIAQPNSSLLFTTLDRQGKFAVYRLADRDGDGDALDRGEAARIFRWQSSYNDVGAPLLAARQPGQGFAVARLTRPTRISVISAQGRVTDIGRSFDVLEDVLADANGRVYVLDQVPTVGKHPCCAWRVYRLDPGSSEEGSAARAGAARTSVASVAPSASVPRLAFALESTTDPSLERIVTLRADGRGGPQTLVRGDHNHGFCQSANGQQMAFFSDKEAPGEQFVYVANADGTGVSKITEKQVGFWCLFSRRWLLLTEENGPAMTLIRHDLRTGQNTTVATNVDRLSLSPDGTKLVLVGGLDFSGGTPPAGKESLELLDLNTLESRRLAGPLTKQSYGGLGQERYGLEWSPDGARVAYVVGPWVYPLPGPVSDNTPPARRLLTVQDVRTGAVELRQPLSGGLTTLAWSPDGSKLLVCLPSRGALQPGCADGLPRRKQTARLLLVDLTRRTTRVIASGELLWADWSPAGGYAYATPNAIFLVSRGGYTRRVAAPPRRTRAGTWIGFSPDGRYLALGDFSSQLGVLDVSTGKIRVLFRERKQLAYYRKWWRKA